MGFKGGDDDVHLDHNTFRVEFQGNGFKRLFSLARGHSLELYESNVLKADLTC